VKVASRPNVVFWPDVSSSPGNYGWLLVYCHSTICLHFVVFN
jgi:hypothetical protein